MESSGLADYSAERNLKNWALAPRRIYQWLCNRAIASMMKLEFDLMCHASWLGHR
jgi:hypothetical protein